MTKDIHRLKSEISNYTQTYNLRDIEISKFYDLHDLNTAYPNADNAGIYAIFSENKTLLYIGKASNNSTIGYRLGYHFPRSECEKFINGESNGWSVCPKYIITAAVENAWEAPSLEEFLIVKINPVDNTVGKEKKAKQ